MELRDFFKVSDIFVPKYCCRCDNRVKREWHIKDYPFYCPECDENMYRFEVYIKTKKIKGAKYE